MRRCRSLCYKYRTTAHLSTRTQKTSLTLSRHFPAPLKLINILYLNLIVFVCLQSCLVDTRVQEVLSDLHHYSEYIRLICKRLHDK